MSTEKRTKIIIDLIEDAVVSSRILNNIEKVTKGCLDGLNSWYSILYIMGLDVDSCNKQNEYIVRQYLNTYDDYVTKENTNRDTAILIYNKFEKLMADHLKEYPRLKAC